MFEAEPDSPEAMNRPPRRAKEGLFGIADIVLAAALGGGVLIASAGLYVLALAGGTEVTIARGAALVTLIGGNLVLAYAEAVEPGTAAFDSRHAAFWAIALVAAAIFALILVVPPFAATFSVALPPPGLLLAAAATAVVAGGWIAVARRLALRLQGWGYSRNAGATSR